MLITRLHYYFDLQYAEIIVQYEVFVKLYDHEKSRGLRKAHKLTFSNIHPTNFERMNARKAAQLLLSSSQWLSNTTGNFLKQKINSKFGKRALLLEIMSLHQ